MWVHLKQGWSVQQTSWWTGPPVHQDVVVPEGEQWLFPDDVPEEKESSGTSSGNNRSSGRLFVGGTSTTGFMDSIFRGDIEVQDMVWAFSCVSTNTSTYCVLSLHLSFLFAPFILIFIGGTFVFLRNNLLVHIILRRVSLARPKTPSSSNRTQIEHFRWFSKTPEWLRFPDWTSLRANSHDD